MSVRIWLSLLLFIAHNLSLSLASPVLVLESSDIATPSKRAWTWNVEQLNDEFKGLYWNHLFEVDPKYPDCTPEQVDKIIFATRAAKKLMQRPVKDTGFEYSAAWTRYFMNFKQWSVRGGDYRTVSGDIMCKYNFTTTGNESDLNGATVHMLQAAKYPEEGTTHFQGPTKGRRMHYTCNATDHGLGAAQRSCDRGNTYVC